VIASKKGADRSGVIQSVTPAGTMLWRAIPERPNPLIEALVGLARLLREGELVSLLRFPLCHESAQAVVSGEKGRKGGGQSGPSPFSPSPHSALTKCALATLARGSRLNRGHSPRRNAATR
jgi:hypothetical protein